MHARDHRLRLHIMQHLRHPVHQRQTETEISRTIVRPERQDRDTSLYREHSPTDWIHYRTSLCCR